MVKMLKNFKSEEVFIAYTLYSWFVVLSLPYHIFDVAKSYTVMGNVLSENAWAFIFFVVPTIMVVGMVKRRFFIRYIGIVLAGMLWTFIATMFLFSDYPMLSTASFMYYGLALYCYYITFKIGAKRV